MQNQKYISILLVISLLLVLVLNLSPVYAQENTYLLQQTQEFNQTQFENEMLNYINQARKEAGVAPLKMTPQLVELARLKSLDMIEKNYFAHTSPTYGSPFDMMKKFGISYSTAGENLAGHYSVPGAHDALMNSSGHRQNILNPSFTHIGIGIVKGGPYGMMFTQLFVGQPNFQQQPSNIQLDEENQEGNENKHWTKYLAELINTEREKNGLEKLKLNEDLMNAAELKAKEMIDKNYLSHRSPTYGYIDDMLKALNISFAEVKENIVGSPDVKLAHDALMNSARHKAIILNPEFKELGVVVEAGGKYGFNIVEIFVKPQQNKPEPKPELEPQPHPESKPEQKREPQPQPQPDTHNSEVLLEKEMLNLINKDRVKNGLPSLTINDKLTKIARLKARDMEENNYLGYISPIYGRTLEIISKEGIKYSTMAESIVAAHAVEPAHNALMATTRHKGNILNPNIQEAGIGIVKSSRYGYIMVEIFLGAENTTPNPEPEPQPNPAPGNNFQQQKEYEMLALINKAREEAGVGPLMMDKNLVKVARLKSQDMIVNNYFAHTSPTYGSPFEMMDNFGIDYRFAGENLAGHYSVPGAHNALMNSPGHRRNILNPNFTHIGIGIVEGGPYGMMFTQMFIGY
ncbi:MAG: hypothetical protein PWQ67_22 [Clostridia bacterium]|nr:hypothetical protein [Clostridia bacterium]MDN5321568.1 hypothetical protein [Clostridia bacterium]